MTSILASSSCFQNISDKLVEYRSVELRSFPFAKGGEAVGVPMLVDRRVFDLNFQNLHAVNSHSMLNHL